MRRRLLFLLVAVLVVSCERTGCCSFRIKVPPCFCPDSARRPQVMEIVQDSVVDYALPDQEPREGPPLPSIDLEEELIVRPMPYQLAIGDVVEISVYGEEDSRQDNVMVAPDGKVYYSVLEGVLAVDKTVKELASIFTAKLEDLYLHPAVTVVPKVTNNQNVKILGRVQKPGIYPVLGKMKIRDLIGEAGGLYRKTDNSSGEFNSFNDSLYSLVDLKASFIVRNQQKLPIDFEQLIYTADETNNIELKPGDYVYIASTGIQEVYVLGAVREARRLGYTEGLTLMQALASSAGWLSGGPFGADLGNVLILRGSLRCPCAFQVDLRGVMCGSAVDVVLKPGDIIYVQDKTLRFGRELVRIAINAFIQSFVSGVSGYYGQTIWFP